MANTTMRSYIGQAAARGATEEEIDILCQAWLLEQKYNLTTNCTPVKDELCAITIDNDVFFNTQNEADRVLTEMVLLVARHKTISVTDYYELCGLPDRYIPLYDRYGWTKKQVLNMHIRPLEHGYTIMVPDASRLW